MGFQNNQNAHRQQGLQGPQSQYLREPFPEVITSTLCLQTGQRPSRLRSTNIFLVCCALWEDRTAPNPESLDKYPGSSPFSIEPKCFLPSPGTQVKQKHPAKREARREGGGGRYPGPPGERAGGHCGHSPFCCRASWRLVSMSCSVAARLRGRLLVPFWARRTLCGEWGGGKWSMGTRGSEDPPTPRLPWGGLAPSPVWQSPSPYHHLAIHSAHPLSSDLWGGATAQGSHAELGGGGRRARGRGERAAAGPGQGAGGLTIHLGAVNLEGRDSTGSTPAPHRPPPPPPHPTPVT